jgi:hypothetical protein
MGPQKWDYKAKKYNPLTLPAEWHVTTFECDMGTKINCAQCGGELTFGEAYTSKTIHTPYGIGYSVCYDCYLREVAEERKYKW